MHIVLPFAAVIKGLIAESAPRSRPELSDRFGAEPESLLCGGRLKQTDHFGRQLWLEPGIRSGPKLPGHS
jgi:hypothetical protein